MGFIYLAYSTYRFGYLEGNKGYIKSTLIKMLFLIIWYPAVCKGAIAFEDRMKNAKKQKQKLKQIMGDQ